MFPRTSPATLPSHRVFGTRARVFRDNWEAANIELELSEMHHLQLQRHIDFSPRASQHSVSGRKMDEVASR